MGIPTRLSIAIPQIIKDDYTVVLIVTCILHEISLLIGDLFKTIECIFCNLPYAYFHTLRLSDHDQSDCRVLAVFITRVLLI